MGTSHALSTENRNPVHLDTEEIVCSIPHVEFQSLNYSLLSPYNLYWMFNSIKKYSGFIDFVHI
jgi:hypothetical protein